MEDLDIESQPKAVEKTQTQHLDPAILSFTRQPKVPYSPVSQMSGHNMSYDSEPFKVSPAYSMNENPGSVSKHSLKIIPPSTREVAAETLASATLTEPFDGLTLNGHLNSVGNFPDVPSGRPAPQNQGLPVAEEGNKGRSKRSRGKRAGNKLLPEAAVTGSASTNLGRGMGKGFENVDRGPGWRQDPLIESREPNPRKQHVGASFHGTKMVELALEMDEQENNGSPKKRIARTRTRKRGRRNETANQNGWATEEATDIQDMGDFDFEGNLSKFDKKKVFDKIREEDTTADEARLVSLNRLPARPGTHGGKNLHFTEMVLGSPIEQHKDSTSSEDDGFGAGESRMSSRNSFRNQAQHVAAKKGISRKGSGLASETAMGSDFNDGKRLSEISMIGSFVQPTLSNRGHKAAYRRLPKTFKTTSSSLECPCISPLQMIELEQLTTSVLGITDDVMTENAATCIAQTARRICSPQASQRGLEGEKAFRPLIVVMTGNHKTGSRAIAAARQLRNHNTRVLLCIMGMDRESDLLEEVRRQLVIFRNGHGKTVRPDQLFQLTRSSTTSLIIDALFGIHLSYHDLRHDDQTTYLQLLRWSNSSNALTLSLDIPSGVDASIGKLQDSHYSSRHCSSQSKEIRASITDPS